jgi:hypothetical protein
MKALWILVMVISAAMVVTALELIRRRKLKEEYSFLWFSLSVVFIVLSAWPGILDRISIWLGIAYGPVTLFLFGMCFILAMLIHFSVEITRLGEQNRKLAQEIALLKQGIEGGERIGK